MIDIDEQLGAVLANLETCLENIARRVAVVNDVAGRQFGFVLDSQALEDSAAKDKCAVDTALDSLPSCLIGRIDWVRVDG